MEDLKVVEVLPFEIFVGDEIKLTSDRYNIILNKRYIKKDKEENEIGEAWKPIGFYGNLEKALVALLHKEISNSHSRTVEEILTTIRAAKNEIVNAVKNYSN